MTSLNLPFITKSPNPLLTFICLGLVLAAFAFVIYLLAGHHHADRKAKKLGHDRHNDGRHGNH